MGIQGVSWTTLANWDAQVDKRLSPWEAETLHTASLAYAIMWSDAKDPGCPSPWSETRTDPRVLQDQIKAVFRSMMSTQQKKKARDK